MQQPCAGKTQCQKAFIILKAPPAGNIHALDRPLPRVALAVQEKAFAGGEKIYKLVTARNQQNHNTYVKHIIDKIA